MVDRTRAPDPTRSGSAPSSVAWSGTDMFVWSVWTEFVYDQVADAWQSVPQSEARRFGQNDQWQTVVDGCESEATPNAIWLNGRFLSWSRDYTDGFSYDEQRNLWLAIAQFPGTAVTEATVIATPDSVIVFGGKTELGNPRHTNAGYRLAF